MCAQFMQITHACSQSKKRLGWYSKSNPKVYEYEHISHSQSALFTECGVHRKKWYVCGSLASLTAGPSALLIRICEVDKIGWLR